MAENFLTYAEYYEDWILYRALAEVEKGLYVDVGANSPWWFSVTKHFYDRGWHGINIEPLENEYNMLCRDRPRDINLNIGAGSENGELEFFMAGGGSSFNRNAMDVDVAKNAGKKIVPVRRLADILAEHVKDKNQAIHFIKIDVEGYERSVLEGMDFSYFRPWIMMLEAIHTKMDLPCHELWEDILLCNGYEHVYSFGLNRFYVDTRNKSCDVVRKNFESMNTFWKKYKFFRIRQADKHIISTVLSCAFKYYLDLLLSIICPIALFKNKVMKYKKKLKEARILMCSV